MDDLDIPLLVYLKEEQSLEDENHRSDFRDIAYSKIVMQRGSFQILVILDILPQILFQQGCFPIVFALYVVQCLIKFYETNQNFVIFDGTNNVCSHTS